jgi:ribosomal protein S5
MTEAAPATRGIGRGKNQKKGAGPRKGGDQWHPKTKLGRLVQSGQIKSLEEIFKFSAAIKEP